MACRRLIWDSDAADQVLEAWIGAQGIEYTVHVEVDHQIITFFETSLEPFECTIVIADPYTGFRDQHGRRVARFP